MSESVSELADLAPVLQQANEECERQLARRGSPTKTGLRQLHELIQLALHAQGNRGPADDAELASTDPLLHDVEAGSPANLDAMFDDLLVLCHKINNPLTSVLGRAQILQLKLGQGGESPLEAKPVKVIEESAKRVAALVQELANVLCVGRKVFVDKTLPRYDSMVSNDSSGSR